MKRIIKSFFLFSLVILLSGCSKTYLKEISYKDYKKLIDNKETFIVEVMRTSCSACSDFKPKLEEVANKYKVEVKYINTDNLSKEDSDKVYDELEVTGTPTVIFYDKGEEITKSSRINGSVSTKKIIEKFKTQGYIKED